MSKVSTAASKRKTFKKKGEPALTFYCLPATSTDKNTSQSRSGVIQSRDKEEKARVVSLKLVVFGKVLVFPKAPA